MVITVWEQAPEAGTLSQVFRRRPCRCPREFSKETLMNPMHEANRKGWDAVSPRQHATVDELSTGAAARRIQAAAWKRGNWRAWTTLRATTPHIHGDQVQLVV